MDVVLSRDSRSTKVCDAYSCRHLSPDNCLLLADSGAFWQLKETGSLPCEYDFPQLGIDQDAVLFTANIFPAAGGFAGADFFSVAKAQLYNGLTFSTSIFTGLDATLAPPIVRDQNASTFRIAAPPSGTALTKYTATNTSHRHLPGSSGQL